MRAFIVVCVLSLLPASASGQSTPTQDPPPQEPTFRTGVGVVRVDVTVTGSSGLPVSDLQRGDFEVLEDGTPQAIQTLQFVQLTGHLPAGDDMSLEIRSPEHAAAEAAREDVRLLVIFLDDYHLRNGPLFDVRLRAMLKRFVEVEMRPTDLFAVMDPLTPISHLGLSRNRQDLLDRIGKLQGRLGGFVPPRSVLEESHETLRPVERARIRSQITLSALRSLVEYLGALREGRKSVLFVSEGPPLRVDGSTMASEIRDTVTAANRSNVTIHTLDPRELGMQRGSSDVNNALSADTGGRMLAQSNDHTRGLRAVMSDASAYYLLGYVPDRELADGKFHKIQVRVRRNGVRVLARKGYWAPTARELAPPTPVPDAPRDVTDALGRLAAPPGVRRLSAWLGVEPAPGGTGTVTFSWEPGIGPSPSRAISRVTIELYDGSGVRAATHTTPSAASSGSGPLQVRFEVPGGRHKLKLRAEAGEGEVVDHWEDEVEIPAGTPGPWLGTPRVHAAVTAAEWRAVNTGHETIAPTPRRGFRRTERVLVTVPVATTSVTTDPSSGHRAELLNRQGRTLVTLPAAVSDRGDRVRVELPVANLAQADYVLRVSVAEAIAPATIAFSVIP